MNSVSATTLGQGWLGLDWVLIFDQDVWWLKDILSRSRLANTWY